MAEGFKTRRGGGTSKQPFGVLTVNFPSGTVTVSNGTISMTATGSPALFAIPETGTWTATAVDGSHSKSTTVSFTTQGQIETVTLVYELVLYDAGDECTAASGGWSLVAQGVSSAEKQSDCIYLFNNDGQEASATSKKSIAMTDYTTLNVKLKDGWKTNSGYFEFSAGSATKTTSSLGAKTHTLDISAVSSGKVKFRPHGLWSDNSNELSECGVYISRVWLS